MFVCKLMIRVGIVLFFVFLGVAMWQAVLGCLPR
jgi:hypothetical protein